MKVYKCLAIDDYQYCLDYVASLINQIPELDCIGYETEPLPVLQRLLSGELKVDLIFLDINMPGINGLSFAEKIKGLASVIFISGEIDSMQRAYESGAIDFMHKLVRLERFKEAVEKFKKTQIEL